MFQELEEGAGPSDWQHRGGGDRSAGTCSRGGLDSGEGAGGTKVQSREKKVPREN